jgi:hypothetical protein
MQVLKLQQAWKRIIPTPLDSSGPMESEEEKRFRDNNKALI